MTAMKSKQLLVTHASVFAVGIAAAMVVNGLREPATGNADTDANNRRASSSTSSSGGSFSDPSATGSSARGSRASREESRQLSKRDARPLSAKASDIVRIGDALERQRALLDLLDTLGPDEFASFAAQYRSLDHYGDSRGEYDMILRSWAKADPLGALGYIAENGGSRQASSACEVPFVGGGLSSSSSSGEASFCSAEVDQRPCR